MILLLPLLLLGVFALVILPAPLFSIIFVAGLLLSGFSGIHGKQPPMRSAS